MYIKKMLLIISIICSFSLSSIHAQSVSDEEKRVQVLGNYGLHFTAALTGFGLLLQGPSITKKILLLPVSLALISIGATPFTPGSTYFHEMEHGARCNPFSSDAVIESSKKTYQAAKNIIMQLLASAHQNSSNNNKKE